MKGYHFQMTHTKDLAFEFELSKIFPTVKVGEFLAIHINLMRALAVAMASAI